MNYQILKTGSTGTFPQFLKWESKQSQFMLDTETEMSHWWCQRKLVCLQFGDGTDTWLLEWEALTPSEQDEIRRILFDDRLKVLHNALFDCTILRFEKIVLRTVYCTMVAEMILNCGKLNKSDDDDDDDEDAEGSDHGFYSLAGVLKRYLNLTIDKTEQTSFRRGMELTPSQLEYAAIDVMHLFKIMEMQRLELHRLDLEFTAALDMASIPGLAEMMYHGMPLDTEAWRKNIDLALPVVQHARAQLDTTVRSEPKLMKHLETIGRYSTEDTVLLNVRSRAQMQKVWQLLLPDMAGTTKAILRGYMKRNHIEDPALRTVVQMYEAGEGEEVLKEYLLNRHRDFLIENDWLVPAGEITINWNSVDQVLPLFQLLDKKLKNLSKQSLAKFAHPIGEDLREYKDAMKLLTTYGESFIEKYLEPDGRVRTTFNVIVSTGRLSSKKPNMQNIPAKEAVGNRYRNCFVAEPGWTYVDSDYSSQELVVIAFISGDPVWIRALQQGEDLHSVCAELVFGAKWKAAAEPECAYYKNKHKCKCKGHKRMRDQVKVVNFGLAYGMSKFKLSATLRIELVEAEMLIDAYFKAFPGIGKALQFLGLFGVKKGYIQTLAPFFRKRWFPYWKYARHHIDAHTHGVDYDPTLGSIERASKNMPIQGSSADMTKIAIWLMFEYIHLNGLQDKVHLVMQVHDQITTRTKAEYAEQWKEQMHDIMLQAGKFIITNGLLGAETTIHPVWTK